MEQPNTNLKKRSCYKCGYRAETSVTVCPQCQRQLRTDSSNRIRGFVLVASGVFLMGLMGYLLIWFINIENADISRNIQFNGTQRQKQIIFGLFGSIILFGLVSFITGSWQLIVGRRNKILVRVGVSLAVLVLIFGGAVMLFFQ